MLNNFYCVVTKQEIKTIWTDLYQLEWSSSTKETDHSGLIYKILLDKSIFTDFPTGSGSQACAMLEIWEYQRHP